MSEVRGGGREELLHIQGRRRWPRGATPRPRPRTAAGRSYPAYEVRGDGREELPCIRGQGQCSRPGVAAGRSNPMPEARGSSWEEQPQVQGAVAAQVQEGLEEPSHVEGQEGQW